MPLENGVGDRTGKDDRHIIPKFILIMECIAQFHTQAPSQDISIDQCRINLTCFFGQISEGFLAWIKALFDLKLTFGQKYDKYYFDRVYYVNPIPVVNLCLDLGQTLLPDGSMKSSGMKLNAMA